MSKAKRKAQRKSNGIPSQQKFYCGFALICIFGWKLREYFSDGYSFEERGKIPRAGYNKVDMDVNGEPSNYHEQEKPVEKQVSNSVKLFQNSDGQTKASSTGWLFLNCQIRGGTGFRLKGVNFGDFR